MLDPVAGLKALIKGHPNWPEKGMTFWDIAPLLDDPKALSACIDMMMTLLARIDFDEIVVIDSRGFIFGPILAYLMRKPVVLARKAGKLPGRVVSIKYGLEYGDGSVVEMQDISHGGKRVVIIDDVLATGGTAKAVHDLTKQLGGEVVAVGFPILLMYLQGVQLFKDLDIPVLGVVEYDKDPAVAEPDKDLDRSAAITAQGI